MGDSKTYIETGPRLCTIFFVLGLNSIHELGNWNASYIYCVLSSVMIKGQKSEQKHKTKNSVGLVIITSLH